MAEIIDIFTKKRKEEIKKETYTERLENCLTKIEKDGVCNCKVCVFKQQLTKDTLAYCGMRCAEFMDESKEPMYFGDLIEVITEVQIMLELELSNYNDE